MGSWFGVALEPALPFSCHAVGVAEGVGVGVADGVRVGIAVAVAVAVGESVLLAVAVGDTLGELPFDGVGVGVDKVLASAAKQGDTRREGSSIPVDCLALGERWNGWLPKGPAHMKTA